MNRLQIILAILHAILGLGVIGSYVPVVLDIKKDTSITDLYWAGLPDTWRTICMGIWPLAGIGLVSYVVLSVVAARGDRQPNALRHGAIAGLLLASIAWSASVYWYAHQRSFPAKICATASLAVVALCTLGLFAIEAVHASKWWVMLSIALFMPVTVFFDGIIWNFSWWGVI